MDFALSEDQSAIIELAERILGDTCDDDRLKRLERDGIGTHVDAWRALGNAGLLALDAPETCGGADLSFVDVALVARCVGRHVAPIPFDASAVGALGALAADGQAADAELNGDALVALALHEESGRAPATPSTRVRDGRLVGRKIAVPAGDVADRLIVSATGPDGPCVVVVESAAAGVERHAQWSTDGSNLVSLTFTDAPCAPIRATSVSDLLGRVRVAGAAEVLGVCDRAIALTSEFVRTRKQFGIPIGMFQAVKQRIADAYIARGALEVSVFRAAHSMAEGGDPAAIARAAWWAAEAGHAVVAAAQHLHGGTGFDRDYPVHRCFLRAKRLEFSGGTAPELLAELGDLLSLSEGDAR